MAGARKRLALQAYLSAVERPVHKPSQTAHRCNAADNGKQARNNVRHRHQAAQDTDSQCAHRETAKEAALRARRTRAPVRDARPRVPAPPAAAPRAARLLASSPHGARKTRHPSAAAQQGVPLSGDKQVGGGLATFSAPKIWPGSKIVRCAHFLVHTQKTAPRSLASWPLSPPPIPPSPARTAPTTPRRAWTASPSPSGTLPRSRSGRYARRMAVAAPCSALSGPRDAEIAQTAPTPMLAPTDRFASSSTRRPTPQSAV